jgi:hypothetical protein
MPRQNPDADSDSERAPSPLTTRLEIDRDLLKSFRVAAARAADHAAAPDYRFD